MVILEEVKKMCTTTLGSVVFGASRAQKTLDKDSSRFLKKVVHLDYYV